MDTKTITSSCECGQVNRLVKIEGKWCYEEKAHGSCADSQGKCFNCNAPLKELVPKRQAPSPADDQVDGDPAEGLSIKFEEMSKKELIAAAGNLQLEIPKKVTKAMLLELIQARADSDTKTPED